MSTATLTIPQKFEQMENTLNGRLMERRRVISTAITALIAGGHHAQYGPPGTAKTKLVDDMTQLIDGAIGFRWLMTRFTTPEELFGPTSLKGLENDEFYRNLAGKMVPSNITFLDEIFKANSAVLNTLLTLMNEGLFFNGADIIEARPLVFCGSNELPKDAELAALWDRITFRLPVVPMRENANKITAMKARARRLFAKEVVVPVISWAEIVQAQADAARVEIPEVVYSSLISLFDKLKHEGIEPSDRRQIESISIIQAEAYRAGRTAADVDDMASLRHVLWTDLAHIPVVEKLVLEIASPFDKEAIDLIAIVDTLAEEVDRVLADNDNTNARRRRGIEINGKLERVSKDLDKLLEKVKRSPKRSEMVDEARTRLAEVVARLLSELYDIHQ